MKPGISRRAVLAGAVGAVATVAAGGLAGPPVVDRLARRFADRGPVGVVPDAPAGQIRFEQVRSVARGREVGFWTAVPHGHGRGKGLPVCLILHGASSTTADFSEIGLARFLTAAVRGGVPPFVLA